MGYGSWIGGGLGWALGGPIGAFIGFTLGSLFDNAQVITGRLPPGAGQRTRQGRSTTGGDIGVSLVILSAAVMKADGQVSRSELDHVKAFLRQQFGAAHAKELLLLLRDVLKKEIPLREVCQQIRVSTTHAIRLQLLHYLVGIAHADGRIHSSEKDMIQRIAHYIGISDRDLGSISAMFRVADTKSAYQILEVDPKANNDEVKKAYRRMAKKYHPDKVASLGEEFQQAATEKFKKVQEAYERIEKERGM